jgi:hypothetical protein
MQLHHETFEEEQLQKCYSASTAGEAHRVDCAVFGDDCYRRHIGYQIRAKDREVESVMARKGGEDFVGIGMEQDMRLR